MKLLHHDFIATQQSKYFRSVEDNLKIVDFVVSLDFSEIFALIVQEITIRQWFTRLLFITKMTKLIKYNMYLMLAYQIALTMTRLQYTYLQFMIAHLNFILKICAILEANIINFSEFS